MGRNSKARRDARRRKQGAHGQHGSSARPGATFTPPPLNPFAQADRVVVGYVRRLGVRPDAGEAARYADALHRTGLPRQAIATVLEDLLDRLLPPVLDSWGGDGLAEAMERLVDAPPGTPDRLREHRLELTTTDGLALGLRTAAMLGKLPLTARTAEATAPSGPAPGTREAAKLAQVRGLLAKAESTLYDEEAEALSAKAQELISKYSLEQLLAHASGERQSSLISRRLWLDAPYVDAKANLVHQVALANRCRSVFDAPIGMCTLVGTSFDLSAVDLLVTSLLAQVQQAMLHQGSRIDRGGRSRTRSFRQSFLVSFAVHIGDRLRQVAADASESSLPVLREHDVRVDALTEQMFPGIVEKTTAVTSAEGWAGGRAAAELARLDAFVAVR